MQTNKFLRCLVLSVLFSFAIFSNLYAEAAFDFGLPLFGLEEVRFEKSKTPDFNFQLLKKYLNEHHGSPLHHLHAITRWFSLIKLSDTPRRAELIELSSKFFSTAAMKEITDAERLNEVFFRGLLLVDDKNTKDDNSADEKFEELLLANEAPLAASPDYFIVKGIVFHYLRHRPNSYFSVMKPEEDLKKALVKIPRTAHYYYVLGQAFRLLGTEESSLFLAIASYEKSASLDPRNPKLQNSLLGIYMGLHEDFQARNKTEPFWLEEAVYKKILTLSPNNPYALNNLGYLYAEYGVNTDIAQELCLKAVELSPDNPGFRDSLGWAAFKNKDYRKAEEELKKSLTMRDNVYDPHYHLATLYYATQQLDQAEEYYRKALKLKPDAAETLNNLAYLLAEQNRKIEEATAMAQTAVKLEPNNASYLDTLGWLHYRAGNLDQALNILLKSAQIAPGQGEILMHIGVVYLDKGEFSTALDYLKQAQKADPNLKETEAALYMALRLKGYFTSLSEYHSMYGKNVDRDRICHILTGIARLYQEERQYEKAIEYTKICADVRNNRLALDKPLFAFYNLPEAKENPKTENPLLPDESAEELPKTTVAEEDSESTDKSKSINESDADELEQIPENPGFPIVISLGPDFFKFAAKIFPTLDQFEKTSLTFFIKHFFKPGRELTVRIESEELTGTGMVSLCADFFRQLNWKVQEGEQADSYQISIRGKTLVLLADRNSVYFTTDLIPDEKVLEKLTAICPHYSDTLATIFFDWKVLQGQLPSFIKPFVKNPMAPFIRSVSRYAYKDSVFSEFSIMTTGKEENNQFMRNLARRLFAFKMQAKAVDLEATIKVRGENDLVYLLVDVEGLPDYLEKRFSPLMRQMIEKLVDIGLSQSRCFISRMFYYPGAEKVCPTVGKISVDGFSGLVHCDTHQELPAIPFFINEAAACRFRRLRLEKIIEELPESSKKGKKNENLLIELIKEYNLLGCPTSGTFSLDENGKVNCSDHEE
jgi:tetratricopeptide (TPR) repeat protein